MSDREGKNGNPLNQKGLFRGSVVLGDQVRDQPSGASAPFGIGRLAVKDVPKARLKLLNRPGVAVDGNVLLLKVIVAAKIVEATDVIGVGVGVENGVDSKDFLSKRLRPEVAGRINEKAFSTSSDPDRGAGSMVFGVLRAAYRATAADQGNARRGSTSENREDVARSLHIFSRYSMFGNWGKR
ncbi:MAG: hypothetical protein RJB38_496 [Pseudomonadota bacterium]|jgi:hypothetical protein